MVLVSVAVPLVVSVTTIGGSGTFSDWTISLSSQAGTSGTSGTSGTNGTNGTSGATGAAGAAGTSGS